jgi:hypothetical protein
VRERVATYLSDDATSGTPSSPLGETTDSASNLGFRLGLGLGLGLGLRVSSRVRAYVRAGEALSAVGGQPLFLFAAVLHVGI